MRRETGIFVETVMWKCEWKGMINFTVRWTHLLSEALRALVRYDESHAAPALLFGVRQPLEVLPQDNALGIIAKFVTKQIYAADMGSVVLDANPHRDGVARF